MARSKESYIIEVHFPENEDGMIDLRKRMGRAYNQFIKNYILTLPISDSQKNRVFLKVTENLFTEVQHR